MAKVSKCTEKRQKDVSKKIFWEPKTVNDLIIYISHSNNKKWSKMVKKCKSLSFYIRCVYLIKWDRRNNQDFYNNRPLVFPCGTFPLRP